MGRKKITTKEFIERSLITHPEYKIESYSKSIYDGTNSKPIIICPKHGEYKQLAQHHLNGSSCPKCGGPGTAKADTLEDFISKSKAKFGNETFLYTNTEYINYWTKVIITCPKHGDFSKDPRNHFAGQGCPSCSGIRGQGTDGFIRKAKEVHGEIYDYSKFVYTKPKGKSIIICSKHGEFEQSATHHLNCSQGCPKCGEGCRTSRQTTEISEWLKSLNIEHIVNDRSSIKNKENGHFLELDIYIPSKNLAIEFNGTIWHSIGAKYPILGVDENFKLTNDGRKLKNKHIQKFKLCEESGILLLQIDEHLWNNPIKKEIWKSIISSKLGIHKKIYARNTEFIEISKEQARDFLDSYHLQGGGECGSYRYALMHEGEIKAVMTFRDHEKKNLNLCRLAFRTGETVIGGANKLLKNSIKYIPDLPIVSFSNNQYSNGSIYKKLGFEKVSDLSISYQWIVDGKVLNKRNCRKHNGTIAKIVGESYIQSDTEHVNMWRGGARCLYDAGYQKWILNFPIPY